MESGGKFWIPFTSYVIMRLPKKPKFTSRLRLSSFSFSWSHPFLYRHTIQTTDIYIKEVRALSLKLLVSAGEGT